MSTKSKTDSKFSRVSFGEFLKFGGVVTTYIFYKIPQQHLMNAIQAGFSPSPTVLRYVSLGRPRPLFPSGANVSADSSPVVFIQRKGRCVLSYSSRAFFPFSACYMKMPGEDVDWGRVRMSAAHSSRCFYIVSHTCY